jgi:hypothetical protein
VGGRVRADRAPDERAPRAPWRAPRAQPRPALLSLLRAEVPTRRVRERRHARRRCGMGSDLPHRDPRRGAFEPQTRERHPPRWAKKCRPWTARFTFLQGHPKTRLCRELDAGFAPSAGRNYCLRRRWTGA